MIQTKKHMIKLKNALNCNFECFLTFKKPSNLDYKSTKNLCLNSVLSLRHNLHNFGLGCTLKSKIIKSKLYNSKEKRPIFKLLTRLRHRMHIFGTECTSFGLGCTKSRLSLHKKSAQLAFWFCLLALKNLKNTINKLTIKATAKACLSNFDYVHNFGLDCTPYNNKKEITLITMFKGKKLKNG